MCTLEHHGNIFILTLTGTTDDDEHRLNPTVMSSLLSTLHRASSLSSPGSVLITTSSGKFFSNGFDLNYVQSTPSPQKAFQEMIPAFKLIITALIDLPMPTVAAVNGHASAAGLFLAIAHDYVIIDGRRGFMYMSEVDIGLTLPDFSEELMREKLGRKGLRDTGLWGRRLKGDEAVEMGVVDEAVREGGEAEVRRRAADKAEELGRRKWDGVVYREIRKGVCDVLGLERKVVLAGLSGSAASRSKM